MASTVKDKTGGLYQYYQQEGILPTHAQFSSNEDLDRYQTFRRRFFTEKLYLPPQMFSGSNTIEFGSDSGENSLVFARWGAYLTIVEPNPLSWPYLKGYFERFNLNNRLKSLEKTALENFKAKEKFRFIDAEGFIYTIKPDSVWIKLFSSILEEEGFFIISYYEAFSVLFELILKLIYSRAKSITGLDSREIAWKLFQAKWNSISHTRLFDSWVMDVLDNPFVRLKYFFRADSLCRRLSHAGFSLYSSWPSYLDLQSIYWHKKELPDKVKLSRNLDYIARSSLSFAFGRKLFICSRDKGLVERIRQTLFGLVSLIDGLIDEFSSNSIREGSGFLKTIRSFIAKEAILADSDSDKKEALKLIDSICRVLVFLNTRNIEGLIGFCNSNRVFISSWGIPAHFAVFRKTGLK